jgi:hypothetical protein
MKKYLLLLSALPFLLQCATMLKPLKDGSPVQNDKIVLVGRIILEPELKQVFNNCIGCGSLHRTSFLVLDNRKDFMLSDDLADVASAQAMHKAQMLGVVSWDEPFAIEVPKGDLYAKGVVVRLTATATLMIRFNAKLPDAASGFIYIGDMVFTLNKKDKFEFSLLDNYAEITHRYEKWHQSVGLQKKLIPGNMDLETFSVKVIFRY